MAEENTSKPPQKRPFSPLIQPNGKKWKASKTFAVENVADEKLLKEHGVSAEIMEKLLVKQVELVQHLVFKDEECQKLKKKFDEIDRNCRRWHDFAIGLQSRVKRLALILHRQQDLIKSLQNKEVSKADSAVQTDPQPDLRPPANGLKLTWTANGTSGVKMKCENMSSVSSPAVVIDLTDEENVKSSRCATSAGVKLLNGKLQSNGSDLKPTSISQVQRPGTDASQDGTHFKTFCIAGDLNRKTFFSTSNPQINHRQPQYCTVLPGKTAHHIALGPNSHLMPKDPHANGQRVVTTQYPPLPTTPPPPTNVSKSSLPRPSRPLLKIKKSKDGIELSWNHHSVVNHATMESYELFVYQHNPNSNTVNRWKRIGNDRIKAMPLPMACTLSQFSSGSLYYFAVRGRDVYGRYGTFSAPCCSSEVQR